MDSDDLELIPRVVRNKLDRVGVKLHLADWQSLALAERRQLRDQPCSSAAEVERYRKDLERIVRRRTGKCLEPLTKCPPVASKDAG
jgi:hypothetical protein